jgi:hypothetical protein
MNALRMFVRPDKIGQVEENVFYSQRAHGPVYRWHYEEHQGRWHGRRVDASGWTSQDLCTAPWQSVPPKLKVQLTEHYVE